MKFKYSLIISLIQLLSSHLLTAQTVYYDNSTKLYGIIDREGKIILKSRFSEMTDFYKGISEFKSNNKWGLF
jgi:hypothetical protein